MPKSFLVCRFQGKKRRHSETTSETSETTNQLSNPVVNPNGHFSLDKEVAILRTDAAVTEAKRARLSEDASVDLTVTASERINDDITSHDSTHLDNSKGSPFSYNSDSSGYSSGYASKDISDVSSSFSHPSTFDRSAANTPTPDSSVVSTVSEVSSTQMEPTVTPPPLAPSPSLSRVEEVRPSFTTPNVKTEMSATPVRMTAPTRSLPSVILSSTPKSAAESIPIACRRVFPVLHMPWMSSPIPGRLPPRSRYATLTPPPTPSHAPSSETSWQSSSNPPSPRTDMFKPHSDATKPSIATSMPVTSAGYVSSRYAENSKENIVPKMLERPLNVVADVPRTPFARQPLQNFTNNKFYTQSLSSLPVQGGRIPVLPQGTKALPLTMAHLPTHVSSLPPYAVRNMCLGDKTNVSMYHSAVQPCSTITSDHPRATCPPSLENAIPPVKYQPRPPPPQPLRPWEDTNTKDTFAKRPVTPHLIAQPMPLLTKHDPNGSVSPQPLNFSMDHRNNITMANPYRSSTSELNTLPREMKSTSPMSALSVVTDISPNVKYEDAENRLTPTTPGSSPNSGKEAKWSLVSLHDLEMASRDEHRDVKMAPTLLLLLKQAGRTDVEVINGGYGIKNPSFTEADLEDTVIKQKAVMTDNGRYMCKVCQKEFALQRLLNRHVKNHSEVKRYLCTFCGKGFNDTFDLKRHTRIHTGVKPYKCEKCGKAFTQRCSLESHAKKVHGSELAFAYKERRCKMYVCEDCGHTTGDPELHYVHLKDNHPNCPALEKCHDKRQFKFTDGKIPSAPVLQPRN
ncbi:uncharacterized protein [Haliotis cracherodii]|uniref:uncharacterized protein n=1 Tax=Haliotis cracherodii TaxID=6455 RepID=UPI0039EAC0E6